MIRDFRGEDLVGGVNNGLNATKMLGANFATENRKLELGGSMRYNYRDADVVNSRIFTAFFCSRGILIPIQTKPIVIRKQVSRQISVWNGVPIQ